MLAATPSASPQGIDPQKGICGEKGSQEEVVQVFVVLDRLPTRQDVVKPEKSWNNEIKAIGFICLKGQKITQKEFMQ